MAEDSIGDAFLYGLLIVFGLSAVLHLAPPMLRIALRVLRFFMPYGLIRGYDIVRDVRQAVREEMGKDK